MTGDLVERAPAKINLSLHVVGRRADGYHELESLVAFADVCDTLRFSPIEGAAADTLEVSGPRADGCGPDAENLVLKAASALRRRDARAPFGRFALHKELPAAAGIGGGSADAAAALRLLARAARARIDPGDLHAAALATGADVAVCLAARARMMRGIGDRLSDALALAAEAGGGIPAVLVNPGVGIETRACFRRLGLQPGEALAGAAHPEIGPGTDLVAALALARNDLEAPATAEQPVVAEVLAALRRLDGARLARMSGSGATCFALFAGEAAARAAAAALSEAHPRWWIRPTRLA